MKPSRLAQLRCSRHSTVSSQMRLDMQSLSAQPSISHGQKIKIYETISNHLKVSKSDFFNPGAPLPTHCFEAAAKTESDP
jgi:hypothetical protein